MLIDKLWYQAHPLHYLLLPFSWCYQSVISLRRFMYRHSIFSVKQFDVPIIVVGNIVVGGSGKTPLVIYLAELLKDGGYQPGIVSRGYGGSASKATMLTDKSLCHDVGDEAVMIYQRIQCPMVVCKDRVAAVQTLLANSDCNIVISDDGLQHYAMGRDIEIAVVDAQRGFANGRLLPAGPLRELPKRLLDTDMIVYHGGSDTDVINMKLQASNCIQVNDTSQCVSLETLRGQTVHALAGIGHPQRFFTMLEAKGIHVIRHSFPDHTVYKASDFAFADDVKIVMTEKDAVKCKAFDNKRLWYCPVTAEVDQQLEDQLLALLLNGVKSFHAAHEKT